MAASSGRFGAVAPEMPPGDFGHTPPAEQAANTPLPLYVDGGPDSVARVVVKYRSESSSSWKRIDLKKLEGGWGGLIPCGDVTTGTLRYYIQGLDESKTPVGSNGDAKHPYTVQIKDTISGDAPHLPGKSAPKSCSQSSDCPPDFPGCSKSGESAGENAEGGDENGGDKDGEEGCRGGAAEPKGSGRSKHFWVGRRRRARVHLGPLGQRRVRARSHLGAAQQQQQPVLHDPVGQRLPDSRSTRRSRCNALLHRGASLPRPVCARATRAGIRAGGSSPATCA